MNKLARQRQSARRRMVRFRKGRKLSRGTQMVTRKLGQAASHQLPLSAPYAKGIGMGVGLAAEAVDVLFDVPWWAQFFLGPLMGAGDAAFIKKTGEIMP